MKEKGGQVMEPVYDLNLDGWDQANKQGLTCPKSTIMPIPVVLWNALFVGDLDNLFMCVVLTMDGR